MKRNKRRIDARLKPYLWQRLEAVSEKLQTTYTEVLEMALEKGLNWYINKIRREIDKDFQVVELAPKRQEDYTTQLDEETQKHLIEIAQHRWLDDYEK